MAKFRVLTKSFIGNTLVDEGAVVEYDGVPSANLEPMDTSAQAAAEQSATADSLALARQKAAAAGAEPDAAENAAAISAAAKAAQEALVASGSTAGLL